VVGAACEIENVSQVFQPEARLGAQFRFRSIDRISPKGFAEAFEIYELRGGSETADAGDVEFCREWESVYSAMRNGPLAVAEMELTAFMTKYPDDGVARYHQASARLCK
jgi:adenylate cyclase